MSRSRAVPEITLLTGPSGSGKTTLCRSIAMEAWRAGRDLGGIISPARFERGCKTGIDALDLRSGERRSLARRPDGPVADGELRWAFDEATLAWANAVFRAATPCELLVVDELGPLEWTGSRGWPAGIEAVDGGDYRLAIVVVRAGLLAHATGRWPGAAVVEAGDESAGVRLAASLRRRTDA